MSARPFNFNLVGTFVQEDEGCQTEEKLGWKKRQDEISLTKKRPNPFLWCRTRVFIPHGREPERRRARAALLLSHRGVERGVRRHGVLHPCCPCLGRGLNGDILVLL